MATETSPQDVPLSVEQSLRQAVAHHQAGRVEDAQRLYRAILQAHPGHPDASHNLGVLAVQAKQPTAALHHLKAALDGNPNQGQYWLSYIDALLQTGQDDTARQVLEQGRQRGLQGDEVDALAGRLGPNPREIDTLVKLFAEGRYAEAVSLAQAVTLRFPGNGLSWKVLGTAWQQMGRSANALAPMNTALALSPNDAEVHCNLGLTLHDLRRLNEAETSYRRALQLKPDFAEAHSNLALTLHDLDRLDEAEASCRRALEINPIFQEARMILWDILNRIVAMESGKAFLDKKRQDVQGVRGQYENLPFPPRNPDAEHYALKVSVPDILGKINQYCFGGNRDYSKGFRVLVAGCGTGDSVIWLAYQLRDTQAEIVAVDISEASLAIAQARAKVRNLTNIQWVNGSLLDVSTLGLGTFDYITCLGVLHHLPDPVAGLMALESVLADGGAMAIMLYGAIGRSHIYAMQDILKKLTIGIDGPGERLAFARKIVANLPATNGFRMIEGTKTIQSAYLHDDTNFWDILLHEQDRAYTASEVREFLASAGLFLQAFISYQGVGAITSLQYDLDLYIDDAFQQARLKTLSPSERENVAEALDGSLTLHTVYATRSPKSSLNPTSPNAILSPMSNSAHQVIAHSMKSDQALVIVLRNGLTLPYRPSAVTRAFLANIDGHRSNGEIANLLGIQEGSVELEAVNQDLKIPTALHWLVARTILGSYMPPLADRGHLSFPLRHNEPTALPI